MKKMLGAALVVLCMAWLAGCGTSSSNFVPIAGGAAALHQFAFVGTTGGVDVFPVSGSGAVSAPTLDPATTGLNGIANLAVAPNQGFLVVVDGNGQLDSFTINPNTGALTAVTLHQAATANGGHKVNFATQFKGVVPPFVGGSMVLDGTNSFGAAIGVDQTTLQILVEGFTINSTTGAITAVGTPQQTSTNNQVITQLSVGQNANNGEVLLCGNSTTGGVDVFPVTAGNANIGAVVTTNNLAPNTFVIQAVNMQGPLGLLSDIGGHSSAFAINAANQVALTGAAQNLNNNATGLNVATVGAQTVGVYFNNQVTSAGSVAVNLFGCTTTAANGLKLFTGPNATAEIPGSHDGDAIVVPPAASGTSPLVLVTTNLNANSNVQLTALLLDPTGQNLTVPAGVVSSQAGTNTAAIVSTTTVGAISLFF